MSAYLSCALAALLVCGVAVSATFLNEEALMELAEQEGYALTLHAVARVRRQAEECRCPPPPPPPFPTGDGDFFPPPPPPPPGSGSSEEGDRRPMPPQGCWPPPHHHHRHFPGQDTTPCSLRPLFRVPETFNFTSRKQCFERWEMEQAKEFGMAPEDRMDMAKFKPTESRSLLWNKGCDMQCHFLGLELLSGEDDALAIDAEAVAALLKEEGDPRDLTAAVDDAIKQCLGVAADMIHAKQVCRTGADEMLFCVQRTLQQTCPGSKWKDHRSCEEAEDSATKLQACNRRRMMMHRPPPPPFGGPGGPGGPPGGFGGRGGPGGRGRFGPGGPGGPGFRNRRGPPMHDSMMRDKYESNSLSREELAALEQM